MEIELLMMKIRKGFQTYFYYISILSICSKYGMITSYFIIAWRLEKSILNIGNDKCLLNMVLKHLMYLHTKI